MSQRKLLPSWGYLSTLKIETTGFFWNVGASVWNYVAPFLKIDILILITVRTWSLGNCFLVIKKNYKLIADRQQGPFCRVSMSNLNSAQTCIMQLYKLMRKTAVHSDVIWLQETGYQTAFSEEYSVPEWWLPKCICTSVWHYRSSSDDNFEHLQ